MRESEKGKEVMTDGRTDKWTDGQIECPLVDSTPVRGRVKMSQTS